MMVEEYPTRHFQYALLQHPHEADKTVVAFTLHEHFLAGLPALETKAAIEAWGQPIIGAERIRIEQLLNTLDAEIALYTFHVLSSIGLIFEIETTAQRLRRLFNSANDFEENLVLASRLAYETDLERI